MALKDFNARKTVAGKFQKPSPEQVDARGPGWSGRGGGRAGADPFRPTAANELLRRAYLYIVRNETVDPKVRTQAMLKLNAFPRNVRSPRSRRPRSPLRPPALTPRGLRTRPQTRPAAIKNRCVETGRGGGVFSEFGLCRHRFKLAASAGDIPGVSKASW